MQHTPTTKTQQIDQMVHDFLEATANESDTNAYCIQGTDLQTETLYATHLQTLLHKAGVYEGKSKLFTSIKMIFREEEWLRQEYTKFRQTTATFEPKMFCAAVGDYTELEKIQQLLTFAPNLGYDDFLKIYKISKAFPKIVAYNIEGDELEYYLFLYHTLCGRDLLILNPTLKLEKERWRMLQFVNNTYEYYHLKTIQHVQELTDEWIPQTPLRTTETTTYRTMEEIKKMNRTTLDYSGQAIQASFIKGTFEDLLAYWDLPLPLREGFESTSTTINVPILFTILTGIRTDKQFTKEMDQLFLSADTIYEKEAVVESPSKHVLTSIIDYLSHPTEQTFEKIFTQANNRLPNEVLKVYRRTIDELLASNLLQTNQVGGYDIKKVVPLFITLLNLEAHYIAVIQETSRWTKAPYKVIYQADKETSMTYKTACQLTVLAFLGSFDILIWSPYKYKTIEQYVGTKAIHTITLPNTDPHYKYHHHYRRLLAGARASSKALIQKVNHSYKTYKAYQKNKEEIE